MKVSKNRILSYGDFSLVNKLTGRRASSTNWLLDNAAVAIELGQNSGLPSLLPQSQAVKLLKNNQLKFFNRHSRRPVKTMVNSSHADLRELAQRALPYLALYYIENVVHARKPTQVNKKGFRNWLVKELSDQNSPLNTVLRYHTEFSTLCELNRKEDWWRKRQATKNRE